MFRDQWWVGPADLDDDQKDVVSLPIDGSYLVLGPPGSGKTNLLVLRANYLFLSGRVNLRVVVFTKSLERFLVLGAELYQFPSTKIMTSHRWYAQTITELGGRVPREPSFEEQRASMYGELNDLVVRNHVGELFDVILLDEVQDYEPEEIELFQRLSANIFMVGDSQQSVYRPREGVTKAAEVVDRVLSLEYHYRNGIEICRLADELAKYSLEYEGMVSTCNYDEESLPSSVERFHLRTLKEEAKEVYDGVKRQLLAYPDELIGVVAPLRDDLREIWNLLGSTDLGHLISCQLNENEPIFLSMKKRVILCTAHSAKGLEFRAVHFVGANGVVKFPKQRNIAYTVVTRAKTSLRIYHHRDLPDYFEQAVKKLEVTESRPVSLDRAFGDANER